MERDSFVFYRSFAEALKEVDAETKAAVLDMLCAYALDGIETEESGVPAALFKLMKPQIDANNQRYENGKKGGRPKTEQKPKHNQDKTKAKPNDNQTETEPEPNVNVNENVNVNVNNNPPIIPPLDPKPKKEKPTKHSHGEYGHVTLTDDQYNRLVKDYGEYVTLDAIKTVDEYCQMSGRRYKDYNLAIRKWGIERARSGTSEREPPREELSPARARFLQEHPEIDRAEFLSAMPRYGD